MSEPDEPSDDFRLSRHHLERDCPVEPSQPIEAGDIIMVVDGKPLSFGGGSYPTKKARQILS